MTASIPHCGYCGKIERIDYLGASSGYGPCDECIQNKAFVQNSTGGYVRNPAGPTGPTDSCANVAD